MSNRPAGEQLETAVLDYLDTMRTALARPREAKARRGAVTANTRPDLTPQAVQASATPQTWQHGTVNDPLLRKLDQLIALIKQISAMPENRASLGRLERLAQGAVATAEELYGAYQLSSVAIPTASDLPPTTFDNVLRPLKIVSRYYERLVFYTTPQGVAWLSDVFGGVMKSGQGSAERMHLHPHKIVENLAPDAIEGQWTMKDWGKWYTSHVDKGSNPAEHFVEFLLTIGMNIWYDPSKARLALEDDYRGVALARIRNGLPGSQDYPPGSAPRIFTFMVQVLGINRTRWEIPTPYLKKTAGMPVLRPLEPTDTSYRQVPGDFTRGSIYAMDGPDKMYCLPTTRHHSALMSGEPISAAGILVTDQGRVIAIDNRSGHYQPGYRQLLTAVKYLAMQQVFEHDAFVSLYVTLDDAMYFTPAEFVEVASSYFNFSVTSAILSRQAARYRRGLPIAGRHATLIPSNLSDFPNRRKDGANRWDRMLSEFYSSPGENIVAIVKRLEEVLGQEAAGAQRGGWSPGVVNQAYPGSVSISPALPASQREGPAAAYRQTATSAANRLKAGGAYVDLVPMLDQLVAAASMLKGPNGQVPANVGIFNGLKRQAMLLKPAGTRL